MAPGSVPFEEKGTVSCVRVRDVPADLLRVQGAVVGVSEGNPWLTPDSAAGVSPFIAFFFSESGSPTRVTPPYLRGPRLFVYLFFAIRNRHQMV